ncbi:MAG: putative primase [Prokaryotic dsDNA virus sp.]|nr:MAG: putative primase [Prokaryotic dsDNA virus sp.]|tara:strand:- start:79 stop:2415 length:2337 start_codon:yes stop_codon:yes gene_type:complete
MGSPKLSLALQYASKGWHVFPIRKGTTNKPRVKWGGDATTDEKTIKGWWKAWPEDNIGIATGPSGLTVIDVDMKHGKNGQATLDELELDYGELPHTLCATTPSGGSHLYYAGDARTTVEQIGPGVDTRGSGGAGGYVLAPGSETDVGIYDWVESSQIPVAELPDWIQHLAGRRADREHQQEAVVDQDQPQYVEWAVEHLKHDAKVAIEGQGGNTTTFYLACVLREKGISEEKAHELMLEHWNDRCQPPWSSEELEGLVKNAFNYASVVPPGGDTPEHDFGDPDMPDDDGEYGPAPLNGEQEARYSGIMDEWVWVAQAKMFYRRRDSMMFDTKSFDSMFNYMLEGKGSISTEIFGAKRSMRKFDKMDFLPEQPEFCGEVYNTWRPSDLNPAEGDPTIFLEHMDYMFEDERERNLVLDYMAWCVQNPAEKPNFAMVIKGKQGTGKSFIGQVLERIFGPHNTGRPMNASIQSQFNGWARNVKLVVIEELMVRGRVDLMNHLKPMITDPLIEINEKYQPAQKITNNCVIVAFTNHDDALPVEDDDRRYMIIISDAFPKGPKYYDRLFTWAEKEGGDAIVWDWLLKRDIGKFNGKGRAPTSASKDEMREAARTDYDARWMHLYQSGLPPFHGQYVAEQDLVDALPEKMQTKGTRSHARKFLNNSVPAFNTKKQAHTHRGRLILWALDGSNKDSKNHQATLVALKNREQQRVPKMKATIYNREMSLEFQQQAEEAVLGSDWDDADDINDTSAAVVRLPERHRSHTDEAQETIEDLVMRDADPLA